MQELPRAESSLLKSTPILRSYVAMTTRLADAFNILSTDKSFTVIAENEEDKSGWIGDLLNLTAGKTGKQMLGQISPLTLKETAQPAARVSHDSLPPSGCRIVK